jgi:hypothetical protein
MDILASHGSPRMIRDLMAIPSALLTASAHAVAVRAAVVAIAIAAT